MGGLWDGACVVCGDGRWRFVVVCAGVYEAEDVMMCIEDGAVVVHEQAALRGGFACVCCTSLGRMCVFLVFLVFLVYLHINSGIASDCVRVLTNVSCTY